MPSTKAYLVWALVLALGIAVTPETALAAPMRCPESRIQVETATLRVEAPPGKFASQWPDQILRLSGKARLTKPGEPPLQPAKALCLAAAGPELKIDGKPYCDLFAAHDLSGLDRMAVVGQSIEFEVVRRISGKPYLSLSLDQGGHVCADSFVLDIRPGRPVTFDDIDLAPKLLDADHLLVDLPSSPQARGQYWGVSFTTSAPPMTSQAAAFMARKPPPSWTQILEGRLNLRRLAQPVVLMFAVLLIFTAFDRKMRAASGSLWPMAHRPIVVALAVTFAGALMETVSNTGYLASKVLRDSHLLNPSDINLIVPPTTYSVYEPLFLLVLTALLALVAPIHAAAMVLGRKARAGAFAPIWRVTDVVFWGTAISALMAAIAAGVAILERHAWIVFEPPALLVSLVLASIAVAAVSRLFVITWRTAVGVTLLLTLTAMFPVSAVMHSNVSVPVSRNTFFWPSFLAGPMAEKLYLAGLVGLALNVARRAGLDAVTKGRWLAFLLLMQVAGFSVTSPTNAIATFAILMVSGVWLFSGQPGQAGQAAPAPSASEAAAKPDLGFAWLVGGAAAFVFVMQYIFKSGGGADEEGPRFVALSLSYALNAFAIGFTAGLLLLTSGPALRGDSTTLKAANISLWILAVNLTSRLDGLHGRKSFVAAVTEYMGVIAALILSALVTYDLARVKGGDGAFNWRDLFKGTTLAQAVPIVSAAAAAVFSALSPILIGEIGEAFSALLNAAQPATR
jgi:hypothetical protein